MKKISSLFFLCCIIDAILSQKKELLKVKPVPMNDSELPPPPRQPMMFGNTLMDPPPYLLRKPEKSPNFGKDPLCGGYTQFNSCNMCYYSYFNPKTNTCTAPRRQIENCLFYLDEEICLNCDFGYSINLQTGQCEKNSIPNCRTQIDDICMVIFVVFSNPRFAFRVKSKRADVTRRPRAPNWTTAARACRPRIWGWACAA